MPIMGQSELITVPWLLQDAPLINSASIPHHIGLIPAMVSGQGAKELNYPKRLIDPAPDILPSTVWVGYHG